LRTVYRAAGLDAKTFRVNCAGLRRTTFLPWTIRNDCAGVRPPSRFRRCGTFRQLGSSVVYPSTCFTRRLLADDEHRDAKLAELTSKKALLTVPKRRFWESKLVQLPVSQSTNSVELNARYALWIFFPKHRLAVVFQYSFFELSTVQGR